MRAHLHPLVSLLIFVLLCASLLCVREFCDRRWVTLVMPQTMLAAASRRLH